MHGNPSRYRFNAVWYVIELILLVCRRHFAVWPSNGTVIYVRSLRSWKWKLALSPKPKSKSSEDDYREDFSAGHSLGSLTSLSRTCDSSAFLIIDTAVATIDLIQTLHAYPA